MASDESWEMSSGSAPRTVCGRCAGATWKVLLLPARPRIWSDGREVHVRADGFGNFVTHEMFGRWPDLAHLAQLIVRFHPDYSPLARGGGELVA
jgi:hypothetical protein